MSKIIFKTEEQIEGIRIAAQLVSKTLSEVAKEIKVGVSTNYLDQLAETFIRDHDAIPAFLNYGGFPKSLCISANEQVVHGIPGERIIEAGDLISIDCGVIKDHFFGDSAYTFMIGAVSDEWKQLCKVTKESLYLGIDKAVVGMRIGDIAHAIESHAHAHKYGVVKELVGHGVGIQLHEKPEVPNYGKRGVGVKLEEGMVIAIEPMINAGTAEVKFWNDGWTVTTKDGKASAHYEHTVAIRKGKADILSTFDEIEEIINKKVW